MLRYSIANLYFIVLLQNTYSCVCSEGHASVHFKGETSHIVDYKEKRHLGSQDYNSTEPMDMTVSSKSPRAISDSLITTEDDIAHNTPVTEEYQTDFSTFDSFELTDTVSTMAGFPEETTLSRKTTLSEQTITLSRETTLSRDTTLSRETTLSGEHALSREPHAVNKSNTRINEHVKDETEVNTEPQTTDILFATNSIEINLSFDNNSLEVGHTEQYIENTTEAVTTTTNDYSETYIVEECPKFKHIRQLDIEKMADVWRITYYTMPHVLKCFKLQIKLLTTTDQSFYSKTYGNFKGRVNWDKIRLEIMSPDSNIVENNINKRKHFLQSHELSNNVMKNIIIEEEYFENTTGIALVNEVSDQWLVVKNLLLMRDCVSGDIVMFTRLPHDPKISEIETALELFTESRKILGNLPC